MITSGGLKRTLPDSFKEEDYDYYNNHSKKRTVQFKNGDIYAQGTIGIDYEFATANLKVTKYHFQGEYSNNNTTGLFNGEVHGVDDLRLVLKLLKII
jgi:hypothetical protein